MTTISLPNSLYLPTGQDSTPGIYTYINTHSQAGDTIIWPTGTVELRSILWNLGRTFSTSNILDLTASPTVYRPNAISQPVFKGRSEHENGNTTYHGAKFQGFKIVGSNGGWGQFSNSNYGEDGISFDLTYPYSELCAAVFCDIGYVWGDGVYGGGNALACELHHLGRHGRTMHVSGAKLQHSRVHHMRGRAYALETGHVAHGVQVTDNTFSGNGGYVACAVTPGVSDLGTYFPHGMDFLRNHSTVADNLPLVDWAWAGQWVCSMDLTPISAEVYIENNTFVEVALDGDNQVLNYLDPHYVEGENNPSYPAPAMNVQNVNGLHVLNNEHLARGAFLVTANCTGVESSGNNGGPNCTRQM